MSETRIRTAERRDLGRLTEIYNYYVLNTPVTFDVEPYTVERREAWLAQFDAASRYRLIVAEENGAVLGYAATSRFRPKAAYETTVETSIYCAPEAVGKGMGKRLYAELFAIAARRGYSSFCGRVCAAECSQRGAASAIRIQGGRRFQREWAEVRQVLGRLLGRTLGVKIIAEHGLTVIYPPPCKGAVKIGDSAERPGAL